MFLSSLLSLFLLLTNAAGQSPAKTLKQAEKALGGAKALQSVRSVIKTGRIKRISDGAEGKYLYQTSQPNLFNFSYDLNGFENEIGYSGHSGWLRDSRDGVKTLTGKTTVDLQAKALFRNNLWLNVKKERSKLVSGGQTTIDGKTTSVVILTTQKGAVIKLFFDATTGLLLRDEVPNDGLIERTDYADYRDVNGVKHAFFSRIMIDNEVFEIRFDDIKVNGPIAKSEFDFPKVSGGPLPDLAKLLTELQSNEDRVEALLDTYSYTQKSIQRQLGKDGILRETGSETYQLSFYKGYRIRRLIEKNGKPLTAKEQEGEDKEAGKRVAEIEKEITKAEKAGNGRPSEEGRSISIAEMLRASKLTNPRRERFRARDCVVFDFEPNPVFDFKNAKSMLKFFGKTAGVMWVDEKDKQVVRVEAYLADSFNIGGGVLAKLKKGATFTLEQERVNDEIWLPSQADINLSVRVFLVKGISVNQVLRSYDYRKFTTEVKDARIVNGKSQ